MGEHSTRQIVHLGHKLQVNASTFTVRNFTCLVLTTGLWPSERPHCELHEDGTYDFVIEHFDDGNCKTPHGDVPVHHVVSGCYFFEKHNQSYNDLCHVNGTLTVSAFRGPCCVEPLPITPTNLPSTPYSLWV